MEPTTWLTTAAMIAGAAKGQPAAPTNATSAGTVAGGGGMDGSGWNVTFGDNSGIEATRQENSTPSKTMMYVVIAVGGILAWRYLKKR